MLALKDMLRQFALFAITILISAHSYGLCVTAPQANLRAKPTSKSKLLWTVGKYMPLIEVSEKGGWYLVKDLEGKKMWISKSLVSDDFDCAVVKVKKSVLRSGPGKKFAKTPLNFATRYMPFKKLERDGAWLHLRDDYGYEHWVYENNLWEPLNYTSLSY